MFWLGNPGARLHDMRAAAMPPPINTHEAIAIVVSRVLSIVLASLFATQETETPRARL